MPCLFRSYDSRGLNGLFNLPVKSGGLRDRGCSLLRARLGKLGCGYSQSQTPVGWACGIEKACQARGENKKLVKTGESFNLGHCSVPLPSGLQRQLEKGVGPQCLTQGSWLLGSFICC